MISKMQMPKYLEEKMKAASSEYLNKEYGVPYTESAIELMFAEYQDGYQQAYADIVVELGPVVEALESLRQPLTNVSVTVDTLDALVTALAEETLKHLKERLL